MRVLDLNGENIEKVQRVIAHAAKPKNWYKPFSGAPTVLAPGFDFRHVTQLNDFRCVFSFTEDSKGRLFRHLSISVPGKKYPNPYAAYTIAGLFGFTGWDGKSAQPPDSWIGKVDEQDRCVQLAQETHPPEPPAE